MARPTPRLLRILKNDYFSVLALIIAGSLWLLPLCGKYLGVLPGSRTDRLRGERATDAGESDLRILFAVAAVFSPLCVGLAALRVREIRQVFARGRDVEGRITSLGFVKDRGRVEFEYRVGGTLLRGGQAIWRNATTEALREGQAVTLVVDEVKPARAYVATLFEG